MKNVLGEYLVPKFSWRAILSESNNLSHSEIDYACRDSIKQAILMDKGKVTPALVRQMLKERQTTRQGQKG